MIGPKLITPHAIEEAKLLRFQQGLADLLCWCRGYQAATRDSGTNYDPIGVRECQELNIQLKEWLVQ